MLIDSSTVPARVRVAVLAACAEDDTLSPENFLEALDFPFYARRTLDCVNYDGDEVRLEAYLLDAEVLVGVVEVRPGTFLVDGDVNWPTFVKDAMRLAEMPVGTYWDEEEDEKLRRRTLSLPI